MADKEKNERVYSKLLAKLQIKGKIRLLTGLHIGTSDDFSPIGAVDKLVVRDTVTLRPVIPGTSLKGKMRFLLARAKTKEVFISELSKDDEDVKKLFGSHTGSVYAARLQFWDSPMDDESEKRLSRLSTDLYLTEIKFENSINRITSVANPRQIERVPAGVSFDMKINYNLESVDELEMDFKNILLGFRLLEADYIGGHGTRGYGRIKIGGVTVTALWKNEETEETKGLETGKLLHEFKEVV